MHCVQQTVRPKRTAKTTKTQKPKHHKDGGFPHQRSNLVLLDGCGSPNLCSGRILGLRVGVRYDDLPPPKTLPGILRVRVVGPWHDPPLSRLTPHSKVFRLNLVLASFWWVRAPESCRESLHERNAAQRGPFVCLFAGQALRLLSFLMGRHFSDLHIWRAAFIFRPFLCRAQRGPFYKGWPFVPLPRWWHVPFCLKARRYPSFLIGRAFVCLPF